MFRGFNIENNEVEFKVTLYKNLREKIGIIDNSWITNVTRNLEDIDSMELEIPKKLGREGRLNSIYAKINVMYQIVVEETNKFGEVSKSRFCLIETTKTLDKKKGVKKFKAMSFEYKLKSKRTEFDGNVMQLKSDDVHIAEGILDKFIREVPDWSIGYVDPKSRIETRLGVENVNVNLFDNYTNNKVTDSSIIWEKEVTTTIEDGLPLYLSFEYKTLKTYDANGTLLITNNIINEITDPLYNNIKKITAKHYSDVGNRFGIEYVFTLVDGVQVSRVTTFTNVVDKKITCENIKLVWETGKIIENSNVKYINIESMDKSWYDSLIELQDQFNSVVLFDGYKKTVSVIHRDNLGKNSGYYLSYDNSVIDMEVTESSTYPNALKVIGKDGLSIQSENIFGGDVIYDYSYYIENNIMSEELITAWDRYQKYLTSMQEEYLVVKNERMTFQQRKTKLDSEIKTLNERIKNLTNLLSAYIAQGGDEDQARLKEEIEGLKTRLEECLTTRSMYNESINKLDDEIVEIAKKISQENATDSNGKIFTDTDLEELRELEVMEVYDDEYYSTPYGLIEHSKNVLADATKPEIEFSINCVNLAKVINNPKGWNKVLFLGDLFNIENGLLEDYKEKTVRLVSYEYIPKDRKVSNITFTNKFKKINITKSISNIGKKTNDNTNIIGSFKEIWEDSKLSNNWVNEVIEGGLNLNANIIKGRGMRNYLDISEAGIFVIDQTDTNKQIYVGSSCIGLTTDGFASSEIAITADGIIAKMLIGSVILGEKLYITSDLGEFYIGNMNDDAKGFGISISDENKMQRIFLGSEIVEGVRKARLRLIGKNGQLALSEDGIISEMQHTDRDHVDKNAPMYSYYRIQDNVNIIKESLLTIKLRPFRVYSKGLAGGGSYSSTLTSLSGGGSTSGGGGGYSKTLTSANQNYVNFQSEFTTNAQVEYSGDNHVHPISKFQFDHDHEVSIQINPHSHSTPDHQHKTEIKIEDHVHAENYGCFDLNGTENTPSNVTVKVNGQVVANNIYNDTTLNITNYLKKNTLNEIVVESDTRGVIHLNHYTKSFVTW